LVIVLNVDLLEKWIESLVQTVLMITF
jgi:hypothetical protein